MNEEKCNLCGKPMVLKEEKVVNSTRYNMWKCEDCKRIVAKAAE